MENNLIVKLADGGIVYVDSDNSYVKGCETCDYGSEYITDWYISFTKLNLYVTTNTMYDYAFSYGDLMKILLCNLDKIESMTEREFCEWFINEVKERDSGARIKIKEKNNKIL